MKGKLNILISILATAIIILVVCIFVIVFVIFKKPDQDVPASSPEISSSESSEESEEDSSEPEESSSEEPVSSEPEKNPEKLSINAPGEYSDQEECLDVMISSDGVTLSNKEIDGSITIKAPNSKNPLTLKNLSVSGDIIMENYNADIILDNVSVEGNIIFTSFGGWKAAFNDVNANEFRLRSLRGELPPTVTVSGNTEFTKALVYCGVNLEQKDLSEGWKGFTHIGIGGYKPRLWQDVSLINVNNCYLTVNFPANVKLNNSSVMEAYAYKPSHFYGDGSVKVLFVKSANVSYENNVTTISNMNGYKAVKGNTLINKDSLGMESSQNSSSQKDDIEKPALPEDNKNHNNSESSSNSSDDFEKPELPE